MYIYYSQTWPRAAKYNLEDLVLDTHGLHSNKPFLQLELFYSNDHLPVGMPYIILRRLAREIFPVRCK
jgi:hypothetical protein